MTSLSMKYEGNISSRFSSNFENFASELLENLEEDESCKNDCTDTHIIITVHIEVMELCTIDCYMFYVTSIVLHKHLHVCSTE